MKILNISLQQKSTEFGSKMKICFDKIPEDNIENMSVMFYCEIIFLTKNGVKHNSECFLVGVYENDCIIVNSSNFTNRLMSQDELKFFGTGINQENISSIEMKLFDSKYLKKQDLLVSAKISKFTDF